jgi:Bacterial protein of unknown function (DUF885)
MLVRPVRICALLVALVLVLPILGACVGAGDSSESFSDEDRLLESLMEDYVTTRFHFYPVESTLAGLAGNDAEIGSFSRTDIARRISWLYDFHNRLSGLELTALSQPAFLDALWLTSLTKAELFDLETRRTWASAPAFYADTIRSGIVALLLAPDLASRTDALGARLDAIPTLLDQAGENLGTLSDAERRDGLQSFQLCRDLLADLPVLLEEKLPSNRIADLAERSRLATRSLQALVNRLAETPAPSGAPVESALGKEGIAQFFLYREMVDWSVDRILHEAEARIDETTNEITELALEKFPDQKLESLLSATASQGASVDGDAVENEVSQFEARIRTFLEARQVDGRPEEAIPVRKVPAHFLAPGLLRLWRPAALASVKDVSLLVSANLEDALPRELELLTLGEVGGRYRQYVRQSESRSLLRRVDVSRTTSEGWLARVVAGLVSAGYGKDDPELELRRLQLSRLAALRLSAVVRTHAFGLSLSEAEREFQERGYLGRDRAAAEALRVSVDPEAGSAALGSILLDELARDYRKAHPLATEDELEQTILAEGLVPLRLIRFRLLGKPAE